MVKMPSHGSNASKVCVRVNGWNDEKKLHHVPTLLQGHTWAVYDSLTDEEMDMYAYFKEALLQQLCMSRH